MNEAFAGLIDSPVAFILGVFAALVLMAYAFRNYG